MESITFNESYTTAKEFGIFLSSDLHIDGYGFDEKGFKSDFDRAINNHERILINGDIFSAIMPQDVKRYARGSDRENTDGKINAIIEKVENILAPYVNNIDMIGCGNHETAVIKYHGIDMIRLLIAFLNRRRDPKLPAIRHGGYTGFIRYVFKRGGKKGHTESLVIYYNHGQGTTAEVTDGVIDIKRHSADKIADVYWLGHKHKRFAHEIDPFMSVNHYGQIVTRRRWGVMTGCYENAAGMTDATKNGYLLNYGEERMRTLQVELGIHMKIMVGRDYIYPEFII